MKLLTGKTVLVGTQNFFPLSHARDEAKNFFLCFFTELKNYYPSYSICEHDAIDIAGPSSMQDACHMNFVIDLAHCGISVAQRVNANVFALGYRLLKADG